MPAEALEFRADILAIAAHRDDVEQTCGGTLLRMAARGLRTAIPFLTAHSPTLLRIASQSRAFSGNSVPAS